jgi:Tfp pilus assembly protein PilW
MDAKFMKQKQYLHRSSKGFTFTEVLVSALMGSIILGASMQLMVSLRQTFVEDRASTTLTQNLRPSLDLLGADIKRTGERVEASDFPAVVVINKATGDELIVRRKQIINGNADLPVCQNTAARTIIVATPGVTPMAPGCNPRDREGNDQAASKLQQWQTALNDATAAGKTLKGYIYGLTNGNTIQGEFFTLSGVDLATYTASSAGSLQNNYPGPQVDALATQAGGQTQLTEATSNAYLIEERRYSLVNNPNRPGDKILRMVINEDSAQTYDLANRIEDFQVKVKVRTVTDGGNESNDITVDSFPVNQCNGSQTCLWNQIRSIEVILKAQKPDGNVGNLSDQDRTISAKYFPRNVLSADPNK